MTTFTNPVDADIWMYFLNTLIILFHIFAEQFHLVFYLEHCKLTTKFWADVLSEQPTTEIHVNRS